MFARTLGNVRVNIGQCLREHWSMFVKILMQSIETISVKWSKYKARQTLRQALDRPFDELRTGLAQMFCYGCIFKKVKGGVVYLEPYPLGFRLSVRVSG